MTHERLGAVTRRAVLAAGALAGLAGVAGAAPPKGVDPQGPEPVAVRKIEDMQRTIESIQGRLEPCGDNWCQSVLASAGIRMGLTETAVGAVRNGALADASEALSGVRDRVVADVALLEGVDDRGSVGDVLGLERALLEQTDTALRAVDRAAG